MNLQIRPGIVCYLHFFFLDNSIITIGGREGGGGCFKPHKGDQPMHEALGKYCVVNYLLSCLALVLWYE